MEILEIFKKVSMLYGKGEFKDSYIAQTIRDESKYMLPSYILDKGSFVKGSAGQGNWATIPWIAIFDQSITSTATKGFYVVYLFTSDQKGVYISLNQGWTYFDKTFKGMQKDSISKVSDYWKYKLSTITNENGFTTTGISLNNNGVKEQKLLKGYELGNIYSKYYDIDMINSNDDLIEDLKHMLRVFNELKSSLIDSDYVKTINYILSIEDSELENLKEEKEISKQDYSTDNIISRISESSNPKTGLNKKKKSYKDDSSTKKDYTKEAKKNSKLGFRGEEVVMELERRKVLNDKNISHLVDQIEHVSKDVGDGTGYDIISVRPATNSAGYKKIYIEVKTTTGDEKAPFYITPRELEASKHYLDNYFVYRVFNFDKKNPGFYTLQGDLENILDLKPNSYIALPSK